MKTILLLWCLSCSVVVFSQTDSLGVQINQAQKNLVNESYFFSDTKTQEERNSIYFQQIQNSNNAVDKMELSKQQLDFNLLETAKISQSQQQMFSIIASPSETSGVSLESIIMSPSEDSGVSLESIIISPTEVESGKIESKTEDLEKYKKRLVGPSDYDSRIELLQLNPQISWQLAIYQSSESVAMIIEKEKIQQISSEIVIMDTSATLGKKFNLCQDEAFFNQPSTGVGTAFIISENTMLTAKHVFERKLSDYIVVFGYRIVQANGVVENIFDQKNLYYPKEILHENDEMDVVEFTVDRNIDRPKLEWENSFDVFKSKQNEIYMLGHPSGLPMKVALNATIDKNNHPQYYYTTLDSFQGNSGSPVFNFYTNKVIGVLVSGEIDYHYNGNCYYSTTCSLPYCKGEKVIRIEEIMNQFK